jgi:hypothetical protein
MLIHIVKSRTRFRPNVAIIIVINTRSKNTFQCGRTFHKIRTKMPTHSKKKKRKNESEKEEEEEEETTPTEIEEGEEEEVEENQIDATHRELRDVENAIHRAVIDAARKTDRLESIQRKTARLRGSAERFRENARLLRQGLNERRRWHLFWAFLLCFGATLIFIALLSWIIVAYSGA